MKTMGFGNRSLAQAEMLGGMAFVLALLFAVCRPEWMALPLVAFVVVCLSAPFFPAWGFFLPVYSRGKTGRPVVALTFDDGPDPETTPVLLDLLDRYGVRATFFVTGERVKHHGELIADILKRGHTFGNHSYSHDVWLMCRTSERLGREIDEVGSVLRSHGIISLAFRPPVGITSPRLGPVLRKRSLTCVNFSCRGNDFGNRLVRGLSKRILKKIKGDDILVLHDVSPKGDVTVGMWIDEVASVLSGLTSKGLQVIPLAELLGRPIMA
ncbi:MAG: polysaccharide deacetylase family protein [Syntrophaceae bacterium]|nr:polysaccharide deacetylase family protein [Syntrophaceae bacterium]